jgi:HAD superfamily hydrolase (TIGR01549 family)
MSSPRVVTFDCAGTLLKVDWAPGKFAVECACEAGMTCGDAEESAYSRLLRQRWGDYEALNTTRDETALDAFWQQLTVDWLVGHGREAADANRVLEIAAERLLDKFSLYEDVLPALDLLDSLGVRMAIISNWDYSLHRILRAKGLADRFEFALASLEEGIEKPHSLIFQIALKRLGVGAGNVAHIGDDPVDDFQGALDAGLHGLLIDRSVQATHPPRLAKLTDLPEVLGWTN